MTTPPQPPSETPTPRTDACLSDQYSILARQLEKELQEANYKATEWAGIAGSFAGDSHKLTTELALLKVRCGEMREALIKCFKHLGNEIKQKTLNESAKDGTQHLSREVAEVLDATPDTQPSPSIPMDVAEKMYSETHFLIHEISSCEGCYSDTEKLMILNELIRRLPGFVSLSLAEKHGLGKKDKPNTSTTT